MEDETVGNLLFDFELSDYNTENADLVKDSR